MTKNNIEGYTNKLLKKVPIYLYHLSAPYSLREQRFHERGPHSLIDLEKDQKDRDSVKEWPGYVYQNINSPEVDAMELLDPTFGGVILPGSQVRDVLLSQLELTPFAFLDGARACSPVVSALRIQPKWNIAFDWRTDSIRPGITSWLPPPARTRAKAPSSFPWGRLKCPATPPCSRVRPSTRQFRHRQLDPARMEHLRLWPFTTIRWASWITPLCRPLTTPTAAASACDSYASISAPATKLSTASLSPSPTWAPSVR